MSLLYAALGDSITHGYDATEAEAKFVNRIRRALATRRRTSVFVQAKPGWTSRQLRKSLKDVPTCIFEEATLVTVMIGGNDLLRGGPWLLHGNTTKIAGIAEQLRDNLQGIVQVVKRPYNRVLVATLYNPFPNYVVAVECMAMMNRAIRLVAKRSNAELVDIEQVFAQHEVNFIHNYKNGELRDFKLRSNPIHPNDAGHAKVAAEFLRVYRRKAKSGLLAGGKNRRSGT